ncbi:hypothetical protein [Gulosibacter chungangensis]|uniref:Uncharacterized protein n=1 Tax=Gulosibacter chungangensis TaxID=979746 RepID=A0A7J5BBI9_9MICO|nr:hypothetical protein [Gulosibacter chungangensis]KAB1641932.1 hypothetical protein F8O05_11480 [Gulosibacter chungangensis]
MFELPTVIQAAEEMIITPGPMVFPPIVFGIMMFVLLMAIALVTFSFRNMAARHESPARLYKHDPVGHPGQPIIESGHDDTH